jgi:hypothetical protein
MPTPQSNEPIEGSRLVHTTCPPEDERSDAWRAAHTDISQSDDEPNLVAMTNIVEQQPTPPPVDLSRQDGPAETYDPSQAKTMDIDDSGPAADMPSPISIADKQEEREEREQTALTSNYPGASSSMDYDFSNVRVRLLLLHSFSILGYIRSKPFALYSSSHPPPHPFCALEASSMALSNPNDRSMMSPLR